MSQILTRKVHFKIENQEHEFTEICDQVLPQNAKGVLNPDVFFALLQHYRFFYFEYETSKFVSLTPESDIVRYLERARLEVNEKNSAILRDNFIQLNHRFFALNSPGIRWKITAPILLAQVIENGILKPLTAQTVPGDLQTLSIHPGKKRLSILNFLAQKKTQVFLQTHKDYQFLFEPKSEIKTLDELIDLWKSNQLFFKTDSECFMYGVFKIEIFDYSEAQGRVFENTLVWADGSNYNELFGRFESMKTFIHVVVPNDKVKKSIIKYYTYLFKQWHYNETSSCAKIMFWSDVQQVREKFPEAKVIFEFLEPIDFCLSNLFYFLYCSGTEVTLASEQIEKIKLHFDQSIDGQKNVRKHSLNSQAFLNWSKTTYQDLKSESIFDKFKRRMKLYESAT